MSFPIQITYRGLPHSEGLDRLIHDEAAKLEKFFDGIVHCRVFIERQERHHTGSPFHVRLNLVVPGNDLAIVSEPSTKVAPPGEEAQLTVRETFRRAKRRLQDYVRKRWKTA